MRTVAVLGAAGQLGAALTRVWPREHPEDRLVGLTHAQVEVADLQSVRRALLPLGPQLVVNATAYNLVDRAETEPRLAFEVNAIGPHNLARAVRELRADLVHVSTDYVFSGSRRRPYAESDPVDPLGVYGASKVAGELLVRAAWPRHFIVRTCGLFGVAGGATGKGGNFVDTMLRLAGKDQPIRVVDDQVLTPTHAADLAVQIARLATTGVHGTYHATSQGECSWYDFAAEVFRQAGLRAVLERQSTAEAGRPAARPPYSVLDNRDLRSLGIDVMPDWRQALHDYLTARSAPRS
jgi:dTDP-4-dehydrorhamnose reductase